MISTTPEIDRLDTLLPRIERAIRGRYRYLQPADLDDALSEAMIALLVRRDTDPTFLQQSDSYITHAAVLAAWSWIRRQRRHAQVAIDLTDGLDHDLQLADPTDPQAQVADREFISTVLSQLHGTTRAIAAGLFAGLNQADACRAAGRTPQVFTYYRDRLLTLILRIGGRDEMGQ